MGIDEVLSTRLQLRDIVCIRNRIYSHLRERREGYIRSVQNDYNARPGRLCLRRARASAYVCNWQKKWPNFPPGPEGIY